MIFEEYISAYIEIGDSILLEKRSDGLYQMPREVLKENEEYLEACKRMLIHKYHLTPISFKYLGMSDFTYKDKNVIVFGCKVEIEDKNSKTLERISKKDFSYSIVVEEDKGIINL